MSTPRKKRGPWGLSTPHAKTEAREIAGSNYVRHVIQIPADLQSQLDAVARGMRLTTWQVCLLALRVFVRYKHRMLFGRQKKEG